MDDCGWVANRWCELLPMPLEPKQRLMALWTTRCSGWSWSAASWGVPVFRS